MSVIRETWEDVTDYILDALDAPKQKKFLPMLVFSLIHGLIYGIALGLYDHAHEGNGLITGLFVGGVTTIALLAIWGIQIGIRAMIQKIKQKSLH